MSLVPSFSFYACSFYAASTSTRVGVCGGGGGWWGWWEGGRWCRQVWEGGQVVVQERCSVQRDRQGRKVVVVVQVEGKGGGRGRWAGMGEGWDMPVCVCVCPVPPKLLGPPRT